MATPPTTYTDDVTPPAVHPLLKTSDGLYVLTSDGFFIGFSDTVSIYTDDVTPPTVYTDD